MKSFYSIDGSIFAELYLHQSLLENRKKHIHCNLCICAIESGEASLVMNSGIHTLNEKKLAIINPEEVHYTICLNNSKIKNYYVLKLNKNWCIEVQKKIYGKNIYSFFPIEDNILTNQNLYESFLTLMKKAYSEKRIKTYEQEFEQFIIQIFKKHCVEISLTKNNKTNILVRKIKSYIKENIDKEVSIDDISYFVKYSKNYIFRIFKQECNMTLNEYILNQKVNRAKYLIIENENKTLSEIATEVGFYDQSHFNKNFKKILGVNPSFFKI